MTEEPDQRTSTPNTAPHEAADETGRHEEADKTARHETGQESTAEEQTAGEISERAAENQIRQSRRADRPDTLDAERATDDESMP